jgi:hypothetical protein
MLVVIFNVGVDTADEVAHGRKGSAPDGHPYLTVITLVTRESKLAGRKYYPPITIHGSLGSA